jgi:REP element-mobilizing transposase RayT
MLSFYRHLPHIDLKDHYQFITFRTKESLDGYMKKLYAMDLKPKHKYYLIDNYLDSSAGGRLMDTAVAEEIIGYYRAKSGTAFKLVAVCVMPNHVHVLLQQYTQLPEIVQILKGGAAHIVNKALKREGKVWSRDYFDRLIRDEKHFEVTYRYIQQNALKAELPDAQRRYYGIYG